MKQASIEQSSSIIPNEYKTFLHEIKEKIVSSQIKAAVAVNRELITLYWEIGARIYLKQKDEGWGAKTIEKLAKDLKSAFPEMKGFSQTNIKYMVQFAREYSDFTISQQAVGQIPWGHNIILLQKLKTIEERLWYANKTVENGWSRNVLLHWLDSNLYNREGKAITNFQNTLPSPQSDLAHQTLKDPYCFDFLTLKERFNEKELENGLIEHTQKFLIELGAGFAFVGRQYPLRASDKEFLLDLLFYHLKLRCFVIVELKVKEFTARDAGQMNLYLSIVDDLLRQPGDNPSIGLLLCKTKDKVIAEYALRDINKPIGISQYETAILESLPEALKGSLPTIEEIEQELEAKSPCTSAVASCTCPT
jgi:predicted nuclease of restriction endonuclease-like (RecB) superfamily